MVDRVLGRRPLRWALTAVLLGVGSGVVGGCGSGSSGPVLTIKNFAFHPHQLVIKTGQTLTIRNEDGNLHGFATDNGVVVLGAVNPGGSRQTVFTKPGTYTYHCTLHLSMKGVLVVR